MVDYVDLHYASMLSSRLERFKFVSRNPVKINMRCPVCGDSQKSKTKARGWLLERDNSLYFYCHNCGASRGFSYFLKDLDNILYNDYIAEKFIRNDKPVPKTEDGKKFAAATKFNGDPLKKIKKISQLNPNHPIKKYIAKRKIPSSQHYRMYFTPKFKTWINSVIPNKFDSKKIGKDEPRLVIPFFDENKKIFGVSARGFDPNGIRYITIMFDDRPKIFGLDTVNFNIPYYVVEGAIDSFFLDNAVAMAGAEGNTNSLKNTENAIFVFDAESRNKEIHKRMEKIIKNGYKICIWPNEVPGKDINEMYINGLHNIQKIIENNTYQGLQAELKLAAWRKV
jgi:hypothetical protein